MHDPTAVAHEIPRPWPTRSHWHDAKPGGRRWEARYHHRCDDPATCDGCHGRSNWQMFPPWRLRSYSKSWTVAGVGLYWPALITVWHVEPGGRDSGEVCKHWRTHRDGQRVPSRRWKWHVHHWRVQLRPLGTFRRWALTRCAWCGGRSRKGDYVNCSHQWDGPRGKWWQGEPGLFHADCSSIERAHATCLCDDPLLSQNGYGRCALCGKFRAWRQEGTDATRILAAVPTGLRDPRAYAEASRIWKDIRDAERERERAD